MAQVNITFDEWILEHLALEFVWGETDCFTLVIKYLKDMYGEDLTDKAPKLVSRRAAIREFIKTGGLTPTLEGFGCTHRRISFMEAGDIVVEPYADRFELPSYGIAATKSMYLTTEEYSSSRLAHVSTAKLNARAWRING